MTLQQRIERERLHGKVIIDTEEDNWGWNKPAGKIRWQRRLNYLSQALEDKHGTVLEIGAGSGTFTVALAEIFSSLTAIDICADLLEIARSKQPSVNLLCMDAHNLTFPNDQFEAIIGCSVLHHLDWDLALQGFFEKLKPGGVIRFSEPNLLNPQIFVQKNVPFVKRYVGDSPDEYAFTVWQIERSLKKAGFSQIKVVPYEFLHPSTPPKFIDTLIKVEKLLSKTWLKHFGGSLMIEAMKPADR
ncbi:methyltransferase domain-containing protein [Tumidithrix elongata RA019]|uniref:Methyltransferase domain-containing protein n=1 Tax=Tumidithrix elongata BACA0141 TaxID=2716417 RepID=A0AAW9PSR6_9CYAN|nr:methyltransferase domain-containing protein [Tumidithrix elongata RA019]